jgi:hypothetical protein
MTSRLRKMFLINAKTSGKTCSGRITELDPRGGAAITGSNGVGKTTTLQLLPLFFGHSPNQIAPVGENRESMLRFVLPHPECAIAYEYQRGDDPADVCLVVLRRQPQSDAPEYRFFEGPLQKEYFVSKDAEGDGEVFLGDAASVEAATKLGKPPSAKHTSAHYRNVILNTIGVGKDADSRRQEARRFSFSNKRLPYLDRLVAAVVKEHINFADFTEVAASIVTDRMGGLNAPGGGKYPQLRQSKEQIERWLRDRDGADRALKLKPTIDALREALGKNQQQEIILGQKRADVQHLRRVNEQIRDQVTGAINDLTEQRNAAIEAFNSEKERHDGLVNEAEKVERDAGNTYRDLKNRKLSLEESDAAGWAEKTQQLPALQVQASTKIELIDTLQAQAQGIAQHYDLQIGAIQTKTATTAAKMKDGKDAATKSCDAEIALLDEQETAALQSLNDKHGIELESVREDVDGLVQKVADANSLRVNPMVDPEIDERLAHARTVWQEHQDALIAAQIKLATLATALQDSKNNWDDLEQQVQTQKLRVRTTEQALNLARVRVQPADGSLHAALLASADEQWRETLARVIDPALLSRTDLHGHMVDDGSNMYGWAINLDAIEAPAWTQREMLDKELETSKREESAAKVKLTELEEAFTLTEKRRLGAVEAHDQQKAHVRVIEAKSVTLKAHLKACEEGLKQAKLTAKALAEQQHSALVQDLATARERQKLAKSTYETAIRDEKATFSDARGQARTRRDQKCRDIDANVRDFERQQNALIKEAEEARDRELADKGVDTVKLNNLKNQHAQVSNDIREINERADLVHGWVDWLNSQGPAKFVDAEAVLDRARNALEAARDSHDKLKDSHKKALDIIGAQENTSNKSLTRANREIDTLMDTDRLLADFPASGRSTLTSDSFAAELKGSCRTALDIYAEVQRDIRIKFQRAERELCEMECSTKEFVVGVLNEPDQDNSGVGRAARMVRLYDRIPREVVVNVNTSLSTILENISEYRKTLQTFESEVKRFNSELQTGLKRVSRSFERFADFTASVVTDFDKIDFIGKLKLLDDVVLDHRAQHHVSYSTHVPSAHTAEALRTFMTALASGTMEINLGQHITLSGSVTDDGNFKTFHSETQLEQISSNGLTAIALIILLSGLLNVIRGSESIYIPWGTDEVDRFDPGNFQRLMQMLQNNLIDVVTASPSLTPAAYEHFAKRYVFQAHGVIAEYRARARTHALPPITGAAQ